MYLKKYITSSDHVTKAAYDTLKGWGLLPNIYSNQQDFILLAKGVYAATQVFKNPHKIVQDDCFPGMDYALSQNDLWHSILHDQKLAPPAIYPRLTSDLARFLLHYPPTWKKIK